MRVAVVGAGRLGKTVAAGLVGAGVDCALVRRGEPPPAADVYWLTVRDGEIAALAAGLPRSAVFLHSSGALGPEVLPLGRDGGVLHPLMSFGGGASADRPPRVPASIAGTPRAVAAATALAAALGWEPFVMPGDRRRYHAAACLASGHLAALFIDAARLLAEVAGVSEAEARHLLVPLAIRSLQRADEQGSAAITGPTVRGDVATVDAHRAALPPALLRVYDSLDDRIANLLQSDR